MYSTSSCLPDCLSVENGVFSSRTGLCSKCLEIRLSLARGARVEVVNVRGFRPKKGLERHQDDITPEVGMIGGGRQASLCDDLDINS